MITAWEAFDGSERGGHPNLALAHTPCLLRQIDVSGMLAHHSFLSQPRHGGVRYRTKRGHNNELCNIQMLGLD